MLYSQKENVNMKDDQKNLYVKYNDSRNDYDDGNIPEIDLPNPEDTIVIPDDRPRRDGPGGE